MHRQMYETYDKTQTRIFYSLYICILFLILYPLEAIFAILFSAELCLIYTHYILCHILPIDIGNSFSDNLHPVTFLSPELQEKLLRCWCNVTPYIPEHLNISLAIYNKDIVQGVAYFGACKICVTPKMVEMYTDAQLTLVLGHELGHFLTSNVKYKNGIPIYTSLQPKIISEYIACLLYSMWYKPLNKHPYSILIRVPAIKEEVFADLYSANKFGYSEMISLLGHMIDLNNQVNKPNFVTAARLRHLKESTRKLKN